MLDLRSVYRSVLIAAAFCMAQPLLAQGLGSKLDAAEKKLDDDIKACRPIKVDEYRDLVIEASRNLKIQLQAAHSGAPVDTKQSSADFDRAKALRDRAQAAAEKPCPPPQQPPQPGQAPAQPKAAPVQPGLAGGGVQLDPWTELNLEAWSLFEDLDEAIWYCDIDEVKKIIPELEDLLKRARAVAQAAKAAGKFSKVKPADAQRLVDSIQDALDDAKAVKGCPPKSKAVVPDSKATPAPKKEEPNLPAGDSKSHSSLPSSAGWPDNSGCTPKWVGQFGGMPPEVKTAWRHCAAPGTEEKAWEFLSIHNRERQAADVPPLRWNIQLQMDATAWSQELARTGQLVHAPREGRGIERENLQKALIGWSPAQMTADWLGEKRNFRAGLFPYVAIDGDWMNVAHYTQMIWPTTTDVGCGWTVGSGFEWVVCRYSPGGNKDGKQVGTAQASAEGYKFWNIEHMYTKGQPPDLAKAFVDYASSKDGKPLDTKEVPGHTNRWIRPRLVGGDYGQEGEFGGTRGAPTMPANPPADSGYIKPTIDLVKEINGPGDDEKAAGATADDADKVKGGVGADTDIPPAPEPPDVMTRADALIADEQQWFNLARDACPDIGAIRYARSKIEADVHEVREMIYSAVKEGKIGLKDADSVIWAAQDRLNELKERFEWCGGGK